MSVSAIPVPTSTRPGGTAARTVDLRKVYGSGETALAALDGVSVEFARGQFTAIMGPSGSGKSTLLHCLAALDDATSGQVFIGDAELNKLSDKELTLIRRDRIGFVFQAYNLAISVLGAVLGIGLGLIFGISLQRALSGQGIQVLSIPTVQLLTFVVLAALVGVLAAVFPARRAARMDVLRAISTH